jgi:hypothetical protein
VCVCVCVCVCECVWKGCVCVWKGGGVRCFGPFAAASAQVTLLLLLCVRQWCALRADHRVHFHHERSQERRPDGTMVVLRTARPIASPISAGHPGSGKGGWSSGSPGTRPATAMMRLGGGSSSGGRARGGAPLALPSAPPPLGTHALLDEPPPSPRVSSPRRRAAVAALGRYGARLWMAVGVPLDDDPDGEPEAPDRVADVHGAARCPAALPTCLEALGYVCGHDPSAFAALAGAAKPLHVDEAFFGLVVDRVAGLGLDAPCDATRAAACRLLGAWVAVSGLTPAAKPAWLKLMVPALAASVRSSVRELEEAGTAGRGYPYFATVTSGARETQARPWAGCVCVCVWGGSREQGRGCVCEVLVLVRMVVMVAICALRWQHEVFLGWGEGGCASVCSRGRGREEVLGG